MQRLLLVILLLPVVSSLYVSEIMINPVDGNEWIEFYLNDSFNFSGLELTDNLNTDQIGCCPWSNCTFFVNGSYILLLDQDSTFNYSNLTVFCVDDNSIGNGLGNSGDQIVITMGNETLVNMTYNTSTDAGSTLSLINNSWYITLPTPGAENILYTMPDVNGTDLALYWNLEQLYTDIYYTHLFKIKNLYYPEYNSEINVTLYFNVTSYNTSISENITYPSLKSYTTVDTGEIYFNETGQYLVCGIILNSSVEDNNLDNNALCLNVTVNSSKAIPCNISIHIQAEKLVFDLGEKVEYYLLLENESFPFEITYWIEDLFGKVVKTPIVTANTNKKSYTPKFDGAEKSFFIKSELSKIACNNSNNLTSTEQLFVVRGISDNESWVKIESIYDPDSITFGDTVRIKVQVYKGETTKNSLKAYIEGDTRVSYTSYFNVYNEHTYSEFTIPIQLKSSCSYKSGKYYVYVEGLDILVKEPINIIAEKCTEKSTKSSTKPASVSSEPTALYELLNYTLGENNLSLEVRLNNPTALNHTYSVWSYVYKGPVSYSGEREANMINVSVGQKESNIVTLENNLLNLTSGEYKLKIKILRDDRKTPYEITEPLFVMTVPLLQTKAELNSVQETNSVIEESMLEPVAATGSVIYESSSERLNNYTPLIVAAVMLLAAAAWWKLTQ